jgi:hypothetical protein
MGVHYSDWQAKAHTDQYIGGQNGLKKAVSFQFGGISWDLG